MRRITQDGICARIGVATLALSLIAGPVATGLGQITRKFVNINVGTPGNGDSWDTAYDNLHDALDDNVDVVWVAAGIYKPHTSDDTVSFDLSINGMQVYGGFHGDEDPISYVLGNRDFDNDETTLSGDIDGNETLDANNSQHVLTAQNLTLATVLDGFTVTFGYADGVPQFLTDRGGGMIVWDCSDFRIANCRFENNYSDTGGAGVFVFVSDTGPSSPVTTIKDCLFDANRTYERSAGLFYQKKCDTTGDTITLLRTNFTNNRMTNPGPSILGGGAGAMIVNADTITITDCDFINNEATSYGALYMHALDDTTATGNMTITDCTFAGNTADLNGAAIYIAKRSQTTIVRGMFKDNESPKGAGAIWLLVVGETARLDLDDCDFLRNKMTTDFADRGGGAVFMDAGVGAEIKGKWTNCRFIENSGYRGGAAYFRSCKLIEIEDCVFVANRSFRGGGALCMSDKSEHGTLIETRICNSKFISNRAEDKVGETTIDNKGGAVYSRFGANTTMVNCIIAGNFSEEQGGGTCNANDGAAPSDSVLDLHNCLLIGNECDTNVVNGTLDIGGGHFNRDGGESELVHCTIVGNKAGYKYGGVANISGGTLLLRNSITWDNEDVDGGSDDLDAQLFYAANTLHANDVDNNVIDQLDLDPDRFKFGGQEVNTHDVPGFADGLSGLSWISKGYGVDTGETTFNDLSGLTVNAHVNKLFKPNSSTGIEYLLIISNTATTITCLGKTDETSGTGLIFDPHICECGFQHAAIDYGDAAYIDSVTNGGIGDVCDLNNNTITDEPLPYDLDAPNGRNQGTGPAPDAGAYEVPD